MNDHTVNRPETFNTTHIERPMARGIILKRDEQGNLWTNVPHLVAHHASDWGFEWGYGGSGPADLALNIAELILTHTGFEGPHTQTWCGGTVFAFAWDIHHLLKNRFIAPLRRDSGLTVMLDYAEIANWMADVYHQRSSKAVQS